jgi:hypothetical protein
MSGPFGSSQWMYASGGFYGTEIDNSLRFNDDDSAYLQRTAGTPTNNKIWTLSCWVKLGNLGFSRTIFSGVSSTSAYDQLTFNSSNQFFMQFANSGVYGQWTSTQVFRDVGSWGHLVVKADTTAGSNGVTVYWNNEVVSGSWAAASLASNASFASINASGDAQRFSLLDTGVSAQYFDGYVADAYFIDGSALDPTSFGETKSGIWIPKAYSGSYGTNGFHLEFAGNTNDTSGNGNNYTANNISSYDYVPDSPTNNFATFSPLAQNRNGTSFFGRGTLSEGNLLTTNNSDNEGSTIPFAPASGKWYVEFCAKNLAQRQTITAFGNDGYNFASTQVQTRSDAGGNATGDQSWTTGDIIGVAYDFDNGKVWFAKNNTWYNSSNPATNTGGDAMSALYGFGVHQVSTSTGSATTVFNAGQDSSFAGTKTAQGNTDANGIGDFYYTPPSGFLAMCSANLPDPAIDPAADDTPEDYFDTVLYTAATSNGTYTHGDLAFRPDFTWIKNRNNVEEHYLIDVVRDNTSVTNTFLRSNNTAAEGAGGVSGTTFSVTDTGYEFVETSINSGELYFNGRTYVGWNWKAGGTGVSNTDGSITSTVSANPDAGFSIVTYTGNATAGATVGHGLGKKPTMIIVKNRDDGAQDWPVQHGSIGATGQMVLSSTAANNANIVYWNNTEPTSSVFSLGTANNTNQSGNSHVAYCFTDIDGFSKAGSYTGNGSSDGSFIYTGFRPAWVVVKRYDSSNNWNSHDNKRGPYNVNDWRLYLNLSSAEDSGGSYGVDFLSNGFKVRTSEAGWNASGGSYIYLAFAEQPFKYANAR